MACGADHELGQVPTSQMWISEREKPTGTGGTNRARSTGRVGVSCEDHGPDRGFSAGAGEGAGEGNRTLMTSLEGSGVQETGCQEQRSSWPAGLNGRD